MKIYIFIQYLFFYASISTPIDFIHSFDPNTHEHTPQVHSAAIFGLLIPLMQNDDCAIERSSGIWTMGTYVMSVVITVVTAKAGLCFMSWTWMHFASLAVSLLLYHGMP